jgi:predicted PurR-regulated permease PerM
MTRKRDGSSAEPDKVTSDPVVRFAGACIIAVIVVAGLVYGASILVPFAEALLVCFIMNALADAFSRVRPLGLEISRPVGLALAAILLVTLGISLVYSGINSLISFGPQAVRLQSSLDPLFQGLAGLFGADAGDVFNRAFDAIGLEALMRQIVLGLLGLLNQFGIVAIYVAFLLADQMFLNAKLRVLFPDPDRRAAVEELLTDLARQITAYLWIMTKVSAATAAASFAAMVLVGLENPLFWAALIFIVNFIPTIGSILGTLVPSTFALVQFQEIGPFAILILLLGSIQFVIGNIILPRMAGKTLNLSLTVTILCLATWGALWGITGMFLAVPLTAVLLLVASRFETTRGIAVALSRTGELFSKVEPRFSPPTNEVADERTTSPSDVPK